MYIYSFIGIFVLLVFRVKLDVCFKNVIKDKIFFTLKKLQTWCIFR